MTYAEAVAAIEALEPRGWRLGLDRMAEFCSRAGLNESLGAPGGPQFIHVAGTNGKGSTTAFLQSMLYRSGYRTGSFFSPYVVDYRERIQFGLEPIAEEDLARVTEALMPVADSLSETEFGGVTKFEFEAASGFLYWHQKRCDWVALEVGLGGRLDATNVVTPRCSVIVSIGMDHVSILGDTLGKIADEKAGIIKARVPVVVGRMHAEPQGVIERVAAEREAPVWLFGREVTLEADGDSFRVATPVTTHKGLKPGLIGAMQPHNMALAVAALDAAAVVYEEQALVDGVASTFLPARFQVIPFLDRLIVLDGAHNADAGVVLRRTWEEHFPDRRFQLVTNMLTGHEPAEFYRELADLADAAHVVPVDFHRALSVERAADLLRPLVPSVRTYESVELGLEAAIEAAGPQGVVLVTGSNYVAGAAARTYFCNPGTQAVVLPPIVSR